MTTRIAKEMPNAAQQCRSEAKQAKYFIFLSFDRLISLSLLRRRSCFKNPSSAIATILGKSKNILDEFEIVVFGGGWEGGFVCWNFRSQSHSKCIGLNLSGSFLSFFVVGLYFTFANYLCPLSSKSAKPNTQTNLLSEFGETNNFFFKALLKIVKTIWNFVGTIGISYSQHGLWRPMQWLRQE